MSATAASQRVRLKSIALPPEHGAWGFLLEPLLAGLLIAPSWAGLCLALGVIGAFLARHPLKIALADRAKGKRYARTLAAERVALVFCVLGALGFGGAVALAGFEMLVPLLLAVPLAVVLFASYLTNRGRDLLPELAGAVALAVSAASVALAGGESLDLALALWAILAARDVPSILYVRARLRLERGKPHAPAAVWAANGLAVAGVLALVLAGAAPVLGLVAMIVLLIRAAHGLSPYRGGGRPQTIGFLEMGYGLLTVILTAAGYIWGI